MWAFLKKAFHFVSTVFLYSVFIVMIIVFLAIGAYFVDQAIGTKGNGEYRSPLFGAYVIISPSMVPNINVYDVVVTMRRDPNKIKVDDIITFISEDAKNPGVTITHRVVGIVDLEDGRKAFRTKGDGNNVEDSTLVNDDHLIGKVLFKVPQLGQVQRILTNFSGWLLLIVVPCVGIVLYDLVKLVLLIIKKGDDEDEKDDSTSPPKDKLKDKHKKEDSFYQTSSATQVQDAKVNVPPNTSFAMPTTEEQVEESKPLKVGDVLPLRSIEEEVEQEKVEEVGSPHPIEIEDTVDANEQHSQLEESFVAPLVEPTVIAPMNDFSESMITEGATFSEQNETNNDEIELLDDDFDNTFNSSYDVRPESIPAENVVREISSPLVVEVPGILPSLPTTPVIIEIPEQEVPFPSLEQNEVTTEESLPVIEPINDLDTTTEEFNLPLAILEEKNIKLPAPELTPLPLPLTLIDSSEQNTSLPLVESDIDTKEDHSVVESTHDFDTTPEESNLPLAIFQDKDLELSAPELTPLPLPPTIIDSSEQNTLLPLVESDIDTKEDHSVVEPTHNFDTTLEEFNLPLALFEDKDLELPAPELEPLPLPPEESDPVSSLPVSSVPSSDLPKKAKSKPGSSKKSHSTSKKKKKTKNPAKKTNRKVRR